MVANCASYLGARGQGCERVNVTNAARSHSYRNHRLVGAANPQKWNPLNQTEARRRELSQVALKHCDLVCGGQWEVLWGHNSLFPRE